MDEYEGKPLAYLDHNILDRFLKNDLQDLKKRLIEDYQIVYSDENLKEIHRSGEFASEFIKVLEDINAKHIQIVFKHPGFIETDKAYLRTCNVNDAMNEYLANTSGYNGIMDAMLQSNLKYHGGEVDKSFSEINENFVIEFNRLLEQIRLDVKSLNGIASADLKQYFDLIGILGNKFEDIIKENERLKNPLTGQGKNWNPMKDFRTEMKLGPLQLNNIRGPKILEQIWDQYKDKQPYETGFTIDKFFGLEKHPIYQNREYFMHQKITTAYNILNTIGYYSDSKTHLNKKFVSFMSDTNHATMACFCATLFSGDERLAKKASAIYEYLGLGIKVELIKM